MGPIGGARVGFINNEYVLNPTLDEMKESQLDLVVAGTHDAVLMVESEAKELSEEIMLGAVMFGHRHFQPVIEAIIKLAEKAAKEPRELVAADNKALEKGNPRHRREGSARRLFDREEAGSPGRRRRRQGEGDGAFLPGRRRTRATTSWRLPACSRNSKPRSCAGTSSTPASASTAATSRPCARSWRKSACLPRTHGSALFTRGETQALVVATLGTGEDEQYIDALQGTYKETFMLHYNFPPYSVGETGRMGAPGRREIGHGKLAWRAIHPMLPSAEEFPYTIRVVSEITESNGSSSMATVCGASLALMDAGVPLQAADRGHRHGPHPRRQALCRAVRHPRRRGSSRRHGLQGGRHRRGRHLAADGHQDRRHHRRDHEGRARSGQGRPPAHPRRNVEGADPARAELGEHAPRIEMFKIPTDKIREVIGTGGKVIREIVEKTGAKINIEDDGSVKVASADGESIKAAINWIKSIASDPEPGTIYDGTVVKVMDFGAFVNFFGAKDGLVHISQLAPNRVNKVTDVVKEGDKVKVKLLGMDERGKVRLSMKVVDQATGEDLEAKQKAEGEPQREAAAGGPPE